MGVAEFCARDGRCAAARVLDGVVERHAAGEHGRRASSAWASPTEVASFVLPTGTTLNKNGAAVYKAVTAVFLAHLYGVAARRRRRILTIVLTTIVASSAGAGVPGSSLVTTLIVLNAIGLGPNAAAGIALVAGIDRPLDMCRTTVNTFSNLVGAVVDRARRGAAGAVVHTARR